MHPGMSLNMFVCEVETVARIFVRQTICKYPTLLCICGQHRSRRKIARD